MESTDNEMVKNEEKSHFATSTSDITFETSDTVDQLKDGILNRFAPEILEQQARVRELTRHQDVVLETMKQEQNQLTDFKALEDMSLLFKDVKVYHNKLTTLKREMTSLKEKSEKLKRRALRLQIQRQKEELHKAHLKEKERELEREITARPAARYMVGESSSSKH